MNPGELQVIESQRQALLNQLAVAETALRSGLHLQPGFGGTARAHMDRAMAHLLEAYIAINEGKAVRSVHQLVEDVTRFQQLVDDVRRRRSQHL